PKEVMMIAENAHRLARLCTKGFFKAGINLKCITNAYTITEIRAHVSLGSQAQYLPQLSLAQIPPKKVPIVRRNKPMVIADSFTTCNSFMLSHHSLVGLSGLKIIKNRLNKTMMAASASGA